ncbi:MAG TPA: hypothetical protein DD435_11015 [Cyanobacteria bacterium UBA8530]|nr:hypothetical protein [Cyanobacteria bacterium UBA8530]
MGFIEDYFQKSPSEIDHRDILNFIEQKNEEAWNLDYKEYRPEMRLEDIVKDVTAFANSGGGLIILGISEIQDPANHLKIFPGEITWCLASLSKEQLENKIQGNSEPRIHVHIEPIRHPLSNGMAIYLIDIPQSEMPPHQFKKTKKYYKRFNFKSEEMEHWEIADLFQKRMRSKLYPYFFIKSLDVGSNEHQPGRKEFVVEMELQVENVGRVLAKNTYLSLKGLNPGLEFIRKIGGELNPSEASKNELQHIGFNRIQHPYLRMPWIEVQLYGYYYPESPILEIECRLAAEDFPLTIYRTNIDLSSYDSEKEKGETMPDHCGAFYLPIKEERAAWK